MYLRAESNLQLIFPGHEWKDLLPPLLSTKMIKRRLRNLVSDSTFEATSPDSTLPCAIRSHCCSIWEFCSFQVILPPHLWTILSLPDREGSKSGKSRFLHVLGHLLPSEARDCLKWLGEHPSRYPNHRTIFSPAAFLQSLSASQLYWVTSYILLVRWIWKNDEETARFCITM